MGAMRNAVKRRTHKERAQPLARRRYGLLEKKKDYQLRAKNYHTKERTLQKLRQKAEERNPDEFFFGMERARTKGGIHLQPSATANKYSQEELLLMKTQDVKYVALKAQTEAKRIEKLQQRLHLVGAPSQSKHTVFVEDEPQLKRFSASEYIRTPQELPQRSSSGLREDQLQISGAALATGDPKQEARLNRCTAAAYKELADRMERQRKLQAIAGEMAHKKELMAGGTVRKLKAEEPGNKSVYKWRLERKK